jgi:hypothetical protein
MAQQIHTSAELNGSQIEAITASLKPFAGQELDIHCTSDTVVERLASTITMAVHQAGIKTDQNSFSIDMGMMYQGVSVAVHEDRRHPPLADAIVRALEQQGITVISVSTEQVPVGKVAIFLGPQ